MNLLERIGKEVRDVIYEGFFEAAQIVGLKELKELGYVVKEFHLSPDGMDKLYVLSLDGVIKMGGTITLERYPTITEVKSHLLNPERTLMVLNYIARSAKVESPSADTPTN
jgi:hypothetical protein